MNVVRHNLYTKKDKQGEPPKYEHLEYFGVPIKGRKVVKLHGVKEVFGASAEDIYKLDTGNNADSVNFRIHIIPPNVLEITATKDNVTLSGDKKEMKLDVFCKVDDLNAVMTDKLKTVKDGLPDLEGELFG